jgi:hypothetical protein
MDDDARAESICEEGPPPEPMSEACSARAAGEHAMLRALMLDAIQCLQGQGCPKRDRQRLATQARVWVLRRDGAPFSFDNVCAYLGLPADRLRRTLLRVAEESARHRDDAADLGRRASTAEIHARAGRNRSIRALRAEGLKLGDLAERFGLSYASILSICVPSVSVPPMPLTAPHPPA